MVVVFVKEFIPEKIFYEKDILNYDQGIYLIDKYKSMGIPIEETKAHHKLEELGKIPNSEFRRAKRYLILGIRKTIKLQPNDKSADYIVPFTSSGCTAMCLYCYLVCHFNVKSYLRIFLNREDMIRAIEKNAAKIKTTKVYELGSNSDMVLENTITGNLRWAIEKIGKMNDVKATFATKFAMVDNLLTAEHNGNTQMRISVNPEYIVKNIEIGTSSLQERINAANKMYKAGYRVGLNIAPIILIEGWREMYKDLFITLNRELHEGLKRQLFVEVIFMTYGTANNFINKEAFPKAVDVFNKDIMKPKGLGKYCYKPEPRLDAEDYIRMLIEKYLPHSTISYIV